jgi:DNA-binding NtrC family response regulator
VSDKTQLLFVDDDPKAGGLMVRFCDGTEYQCHSYRSPDEALDHFRERGADIIVTDLRMPGMTGIELLQRVREQDSEVPVIVITAYSSVEDAIEALRLGASDFLRKPFDMDELLLVVKNTLERTRLKRENQLLRRQLQSERREQGLIGQSPALQKVYGMIEKIADVNCNVIINGESGTGKELAARAIHQLGPDPDKPFVVVDCGALTDTLLESELFGHEKGAFTGAAGMHRGLFEAARGGTLFLDEIGNISEAMQVKLLRVIQERQITRVGGVRPIEVDVRILVATNADLAQMVREGRFREDLYHRLNVVRILMPPLRERREDIPLLIQHFVDHFARAYRRDVQGFDVESLRRLQNHPWPGNIRELRNLVERHVVLAGEPLMQLEESGETTPCDDSLCDDRPSLSELERRYILKVLEEEGDNRARAAEVLGIDKSTLWRKLQSYA